MRYIRISKTSLLFCIFSFLPAYAVDLPGPLSVPSSIPERKASALNVKKISLESWKYRIEQDYEHHIRDCTNVPRDRLDRCRKEKLRLESEILEYSDALREQKQTLVAAIDRELRSLESKISRLKGRIAGFRDDREAFLSDLEEWADLGVEARESARQAALDATISIVTAGVGDQNTARKELTQEQMNSVERLLKEYGPFLDHAKKGASKRLANLAKEGDVVAVLEFVHATTKSVDADSVNAKSRDRVLMGVTEILSLFVNDPRLKLVVVNIDVWTSAMYGWAGTYVARERIEQLVDLSEKRLLALDSLSKEFRNAIDRRRNLRRDKELLLGSVER